MFDESTCFNCGKPSSGNSLYCSETCRIQDSGDAASASASNSSVAPSSASSSPSRNSPKIVPFRTRSGQNSGNKYSSRPSRASSRTSSPSLNTSDLPEFSDYDVEVAATHHTKMGRVSQDHTFNQALFHTSQKVLDHEFWKSRYAEMGTPAPLSAYEREAARDGPKSVPGITTSLHYIRKPGPINAANNAGASKLAAGFSPYKGNSHKRYGSEYGFHGHLSRGDQALQGRLSKQKSIDSATSSTPRSRSGVVPHSPPLKRLQSTTSESTLSASVSKPASVQAASGVRHVSDTVVHTLRKSIEPLTAVDLPVDTPSSYRRSSVRTDSLALSALKDVARSHGMIDGKSRTSKTRLTKESSMSSLSRTAQFLGLNTTKTESSTAVNGASIQKSGQPSQDQKGTEKHSEASFDGRSNSPDQEGRGRSRKRNTPSRSPSPPTWASWAEDEPIDRRRGRSARRGQ